MNSETSTQIDPLFQLPGWHRISLGDLPVVEAQSAIIDTQSERIIALMEEIERLKLKIRQLGGTV